MSKWGYAVTKVQYALFYSDDKKFYIYFDFLLSFFLPDFKIKNNFMLPQNS